MILQGKRVLVMGLMDTHSISWAIGQKAASLGAEVSYTVQNQRFKDSMLKRSFQKEGLNIDDYRILSCDVTQDEELKTLFGSGSPAWDGIVHCIAYANPKTCLAESMLVAPREDVLKAFEISAASLAFVAKEAQAQLNPGASILTLTFSSDRVFPNYNWMGVCKAALEATARYLARDLGPAGIRVNCISAGPQDTVAATHIPGFANMAHVWPGRSPLGWDVKGRDWVAASACYLLSDLSQGVTGEVLHVDGGFHAMAMEVAPAPPQQ